MTTHIYGLVDPRTGLIFYVGKTTDLTRRLWRHVRDASEGCGVLRSRRIRSIMRAGHKPRITCLESVEGDGCGEEIFHIKLARADGLQLTNMTKGGDGASGAARTPEFKAAASQRGKARWADPTWRGNMLAKMRTFRHSDASRAKMSAVRKGVPKSDAFKAMVSRTQKGRRHSPEVVARRAAKRRGQPMPQSAKDAISRLHKGRKHTPEHVQKAALALSLSFGDHVARMASAAEVRRVRVERGISQREAGEAIGSNQAQISAIERGRLIPSMAFLSRLHAALARLEPGRANPLPSSPPAEEQT